MSFGFEYILIALKWKTQGVNILKKLLIAFIQIAVLMLFVQGCSKQVGNEYAKVNRMLADMDTYTTRAEIIVKGTKNVESYVVKQYFKYPDRYRIEVISPPDKQGKITIYDGVNLKIYQPSIKQLYVMENYKEVEEGSMFPGHFAKNLFSSEHAIYNDEKDKDGEYISVKVAIPGGNRYRKWQILYFDKETIKPVKMEVLDSEGNIAVAIYYRDFLYNAKLDNKIFLLDEEMEKS